MNLLLIAYDDELTKSIHVSRLFAKIEVWQDVHEVKNIVSANYQVVLISDRIVDFELLPYMREKFKNQTLFYLLNRSSLRISQQIEPVAHAQDINIIYPTQTNTQIIRHMESILKPEENADKYRVVAFYGTHPQVGVTSTVMSIASRLGILTGTKIGVLGLNPWNPGDYFFRYNGNYLDELSTQLANKILTPSQLLSSMGICNSFHYLAGNRSIKKQFKYYVEEVLFLIELAKEVFDLVLIDAGAHFDNAMSLQALSNSDVNFLITNQQGWGHRFWTYSFEQIIEPLGFRKSDFLLIINKYQQSAQLLTAKQIAQEYGLPLVRYIADLGHLGISAEREKLLLLDYNDPEYDKDIYSLAQTLIKLYSLPLAPTLTAETPKKSIFYRLFGVKGA